MRKEIFIVVGRSGDYEDRGEWNVFAFEKEDDAKEHAKLASSEVDRIDQEEAEERNEIRRREDIDYNNKHDPFMIYDCCSRPVYRVEQRTLFSKKSISKK